MRLLLGAYGGSYRSVAGFGIERSQCSCCLVRQGGSCVGPSTFRCRSCEGGTSQRQASHKAVQNLSCCLVRCRGSCGWPSICPCKHCEGGTSRRQASSHRHLPLRGHQHPQPGARPVLQPVERWASRGVVALPWASTKSAQYSHDSRYHQCTIRDGLVKSAQNLCEFRVSIDAHSVNAPSWRCSREIRPLHRGNRL